jgi:hypothetical protein
MGMNKMKNTALRVFSAGLLMSGASLIHAQSAPPNILRIFREDIKSGKGAAHEKVESAYARAFNKAGYPSYIGMDNLTGTSQAWFLESYDSYESMGKAVQLAATEPLKSTVAQLDAQDGELRTGERGMIAVLQKDASYLPGQSNLAKARFVQINTVRVRPGHVADFTEMRKLLNAAFEKSGNKQRRAVYSVSSGSPAGTYLILGVMDSLKAMDPPASAMSMANAFGADNLARYNKLQAEIVVSSESTLFTVNPKLSNPAKEFIAADPDFWTPKPKAAAKPAGSQ